jgi:hypothetical protein
MLTGPLYKCRFIFGCRAYLIKLLVALNRLIAKDGRILSSHTLLAVQGQLLATNQAGNVRITFNFAGCNPNNLPSAHLSSYDHRYQSHSSRDAAAILNETFWTCKPRKGGIRTNDNNREV